MYKANRSPPNHFQRRSSKCTHHQPPLLASVLWGAAASPSDEAYNQMAWAPLLHEHGAADTNLHLGDSLLSHPEPPQHQQVRAR
jgi:hypothetical protein